MLLFLGHKLLIWITRIFLCSLTFSWVWLLWNPSKSNEGRKWVHGIYFLISHASKLCEFGFAQPKATASISAKHLQHSLLVSGECCVPFPLRLLMAKPLQAMLCGIYLVHDKGPLHSLNLLELLPFKCATFLQLWYWHWFIQLTYNFVKETWVIHMTHWGKNIHICLCVYTCMLRAKLRKLSVNSKFFFFSFKDRVSLCYPR